MNWYDRTGTIRDESGRTYEIEIARVVFVSGYMIWWDGDVMDDIAPQPTVQAAWNAVLAHSAPSKLERIR
jgi:hypothetical protein